MSSGFCCAATMPASRTTSNAIRNNANPSLSIVPFFAAITGFLDLSFSPLFIDSDAQPRRFAASNHCGPLRAFRE
jgi:hypothetical protein